VALKIKIDEKMLEKKWRKTEKMVGPTRFLTKIYAIFMGCQLLCAG